MTSERPILFSGPMVRAILDGRKTQTRRVVKPQPTGMLEWIRRKMYIASSSIPAFQAAILAYCPYGQPGDRLWVKESFSVSGIREGYQNPHVSDDFECASAIISFPDGDNFVTELLPENDFGKDEIEQAIRASRKKTVPSIHMSRWASRILLEIVSVRVERLQDISRSDCMAEGLKSWPHEDDLAFGYYGCWPAGHATPTGAYRALWESINGPASWDDNPWVWVIEFKRVSP